MILSTIESYTCCNLCKDKVGYNFNFHRSQVGFFNPAKTSMSSLSLQSRVAKVMIIQEKIMTRRAVYNYDRC